GEGRPRTLPTVLVGGAHLHPEPVPGTGGRIRVRDRQARRAADRLVGGPVAVPVDLVSEEAGARHPHGGRLVDRRGGASPEGKGKHLADDARCRAGDVGGGRHIGHGHAAGGGDALPERGGRDPYGTSSWKVGRRIVGINVRQVERSVPGGEVQDLRRTAV